MRAVAVAAMVLLGAAMRLHAGVQGLVLTHQHSLSLRAAPRHLHHRRVVLAPALRMTSSSTPQTVTEASFSSSDSPSSVRIRRTRVRSILNADDQSILGQEVVVKGWVRTKREQKTFSFIEVNDGSSMGGLQVVAPEELPGYADCMGRITTGASVAVRGTVHASPGKGQRFELRAMEVEVLGECPADYPLQKKRHTIEFLRGIAHLRPRTNTISAVSRVRSALAQSTHQFFQQQGFVYLQTPIITASDTEGAGELFRVTTLSDDIGQLPKTEDGKIDYAADFFGKAAYLTVSGQLAAETHACALGDVYTFGPTFRAENSQTTRHLAEFNMIEPEMAFADLQDDMDNAEAFVKHVTAHVLQNCEDDLAFFSQFYDKELLGRLERLVIEPFVRVKYEDAVDLLRAEISKDPSKWQYPDVDFGSDLQTEHERWLAEKHFNAATFVYNYPREIKAFYMKDNEDGRTVAAMDLLVPGVGELIGGSQREDRLEVLQAKMVEFGLDPEDYWWYMDLRKYGSVPHAGYGLGFERLVCYVTGIDNIREAIAFPRVPGNADF
jgi:asparaginyl-tRNA synthetase